MTTSIYNIFEINSREGLCSSFLSRFFIFRKGLPMELHNNTTLRITFSKSGTIFLHLVNGRRNIGTLTADGQTYTKTIIPSLHIHRKSNSIGFNYQLLKQSSFKWIVVKAEGYENLVTSRKYILQFGKYLYFKNEGFEKQIFLPLSDFGIDKARQFENGISNQQNLFAEVG